MKSYVREMQEERKRMRETEILVGLYLDVRLENFRRVRDLVKEWDPERKLVRTFGYPPGDQSETDVSILLEDHTKVSALRALMDKLEPLAVPGTLRISRARLIPARGQP